MFNVSDAYNLAVADSHRKSTMRAVLKTASATYNITDEDIIKDTVYITNQCTNGNDFEYGCVYSAECGLSIKSDIDRYSLYNAEISLFWSLKVGENTWEEIPLGVFIITEPTRVNDKIKIKALDKMTLLDVSVNEDTQGTFAELIVYVAEKCGVSLAQNTDYFSTLPNASDLLSVYQDSIDTYRDLIAYMCMLNACFATFDRYGRLKIVQYATEPCFTLSKSQRFSNATFSDYITNFSKVRARFIANENYATYETDGAGDGLVLNLGGIPILRGLPETKKRALNNIYAVLQNVRYTPYELETFGNPALDLGDVIQNINVGKHNITYVAPITYYKWQYRGKQKLKAVGGNPKLASVTSKQGKQMSSIEQGLSSKDLNVKEARNADKLIFSNADTQILTLNFAATEQSKPIFLVTIRVTMSLDGILILKFCTDGALEKGKEYKVYLERGYHTVCISEVYNMDNNDRHTFSITARTEYFESDKRKQDADIQTHNNFLNALSTLSTTVVDNVVQFPTYAIAELDTTVPTATIEKEEALGILFSQGMANDKAWDGTINVVENIGLSLPFANNFTFTNNVVENVSVATQTPKTASINVSVGSLAFNNAFRFNAINDIVNIGDVIVDYVFNTINADKYTFDNYISTNNDMFSLKSIFTYTSAEQTIDAGKLASVAIDYSNINVESVVVTNG